MATQDQQVVWPIEPRPPVEPYQHSREDALASGIRPMFYGFMLAVATWAIGVFLALVLRSLAILFYGFAAGFLVAALTIIALTFGEIAFYYVERQLKIDIDRNGYIGKPPTVIEDTRFIPVRSAATHRMTERDQLIEFIRGSEVDPTERRWFPVIGEDRYNLWRDWLLSCGWARWRNKDHRQGWTLAETAASIIALLPDDDTSLPITPSPTPTVGGVNWAYGGHARHAMHAGDVREHDKSVSLCRIGRGGDRMPEYESYGDADGLCTPSRRCVATATPAIDARVVAEQEHTLFLPATFIVLAASVIGATVIGPPVLLLGIGAELLIMFVSCRGDGEMPRQPHIEPALRVGPGAVMPDYVAMGTALLREADLQPVERDR